MIKYIIIFIIGIAIGYFAGNKTQKKEKEIVTTIEKNSSSNNEYEYILYNEKAELKNILNSLFKECQTKSNSSFTLTVKDKNETYNLKIDSNHSNFLEKYNGLNVAYAECKDINNSTKYRFLSHREQILNK